MSINYTQLTEERTTSTKIYGYDQITAVSQASINYQLASMYKLNPTLKKLSAHLDGDDFAGIDANLDVSDVELQLNTDSEYLILIGSDV